MKSADRLIASYLNPMHNYAFWFGWLSSWGSTLPASLNYWDAKIKNISGETRHSNGVGVFIAN